ncbi:unnamed protein product [Rotaria socialis]|uniref:Receptor expression-enhancing protein n=1 Tax=Rotaria socialis TaxID=392032 RepID=A0A817Q8N8_9BILA|nr:unnamed protein product [Rotaria socialis]
MAAAVQNQIRKVEEKIKPYLYEGPLTSYWGLVEGKTKVKREQIAFGILGLLALYLLFGWGNDFLCNFLGFIYPAYASVLAVESKGSHDDTEWLMYWVIYALFGFIEYIGYSFFQTLPFYWLGKCIFLVWLMVPGDKGGSKFLYTRFVRPFALKHRSTVDQHLRDAKAYASKCAPNSCNTISRPPGQMYQLLRAPCAFYPGRPPCSMFPTLNNKQHHAIVDTGSAVTIINQQFIKTIYHTDFVYKNKLHKSANCTSISIIGEIQLEVKIQGHKTLIIADVTTNLITDILLGNDWIMQNNVIIDSLQRHITLIDKNRRD